MKHEVTVSLRLAPLCSDTIEVFATMQPEKQGSIMLGGLTLTYKEFLDGVIEDAKRIKVESIDGKITCRTVLEKSSQEHYLSKLYDFSDALEAAIKTLENHPVIDD